MSIVLKRAIRAAILATSMTVTAPAFASGMLTYDALVHATLLLTNTAIAGVSSAVASTTAAVQGMNQNLAQILNKIGSAVNENGQKIASTIEADGKSTRDFIAESARLGRKEDARQRFAVGANICSESASGGAAKVNSQGGASKGATRPGSAKISNQDIARAVNTPAVAPDVDAARSAKIHAQFCDADDFAAYGGSRACPSVSRAMPGADKRVDSVLAGAGPDGKVPDLTFNQEQADAALMYVQNAGRRSVGPQLKKGEAETTAGSQYIGLMNQYNAVISAANDPLESRIANSLPNPETKELLKEAVMAASAKSYYDQVASKEARRTGVMSAREFESFEVGRRYSNTEYQADLQEMSADNLIREQIRVASLQSWLLLGIKDQLEKNNMINGLQLASSARAEYEPMLQEKRRAVSGRMGGE